MLEVDCGEIFRNGLRSRVCSSGMFDWNDEEFMDTNWGQAHENGDHIVPYPKGREEKALVQCGPHYEKQCSKEESPDKHAEQNKMGASNDLSGFKLESNSQCNTDELSALEIDSWPNSPLPSAACSKDYGARIVQDSMDTAELDIDPQLFGNQHEEKEHGDFLDYSWANIGTFDDLDTIFRNDDPIFGLGSLGNADELWSSTTDVRRSPKKSLPASADSPSLGLGALSNMHEQYEMETEFVQHEDHPSGGERKSFPALECAGGKSNPLMERKVTGQREPLKYPKTEDEGETKSQDLCGTWPLDGNKFQQFGKQFQQFGNQFQTSSPSSVLSRQRHLSGPQSFMCLQTSHPYLSYYPVVPGQPHVNSERDKDQSAISGYRSPKVYPKNVNPVKKFPDVLFRPTSMTPQEKIEKLRQRQQMQAMLAIQEQQQQLGNKATGTDYSNTQRCPQENQSQDTEGSSIEFAENLKVPAVSESDSPIEQDDSNTIAMLTDDYLLEERLLNQLQDVIGKLDMSTRLCIRDSLFRLAQNATQRHNSNDTSSTNNCMDEHEVATKEETERENRLAEVPETEKKTNPIDRTVVHLLFRLPLETSTKPLKGGHIPESPKPKTEGFLNMPTGCLSDLSTDKQRPIDTPSMVAEPYSVNQF